MAQRDTQRSPRYAAINLSTDETVIYDKENHESWIQGYGHPVEDMR